MNAARKIVRLLAVCCVCAVVSPAEEEAAEPDISKPDAVTMEITALDVDDSTLVLSYNIRVQV